MNSFLCRARATENFAHLTARQGASREVSFPAIGDFKASSSLARNNDVAMSSAQFDLSNVTTSSIDFFSDQSRALLASGLFASRNIPAAMDANGGCEVEIGLRHTFILLSMYARAIIW